MADLNIALILRLVDRATGPARQALQQVERVSNRIGQSGLRTLELADRMDAASRQRRGNLALEVTAAAGVGYAFYRAMQPAIEFEAAMAKVGAVSRASDGDLARLTATAQELGAKTPWAAREAADGMQYLAMAGFDVNEVIDAMPGLLDLASAGATDLGRTSDIASNILSGFRLRADQMGEVGDILTNTFTTSNTDLSMLGSTMEEVAPVATDFGISLQTVAGMAGKLGDSGLQGGKAGTALRAILARLAAPSGEAAEALAALNVQVADADGNLRPLPDIMAELSEKTKAMGSAARGDLMSTVFGLEAMSAASVLIGQSGSGELQAYIETLSEAGSAGRVAGKINDNTAGSIKRMQSAMEALSIAAGTALLPALTDLLETITPYIQKASEWAQQNPELISQIGEIAAVLFGAKVGMLALRFAFEPVIALVAFGIRAFGWLQIGIGLVGRVLIGLSRLVMGHPIIALLVLLASAAYAIYQNWDGFVQYFADKINAVKAAFQTGLLDGVFKLVKEFNPFTLALDGAVALFEYLMGWDFGTVRDALASIVDQPWFQMGVDLISSLSAGIWSVLTGLVDRIQASLASIVPQWVIDGKAWIDGTAATGQVAAPGVIEEHAGVGGTYAGRRALGGPVRAGGIYEVNERGQEFFAPGQSGSIITARDARGGGAAATRQVTFGDIIVNAAPGMDASAVARMVRRELRDLMDARNALHDGGLYDQ